MSLIQFTLIVPVALEEAVLDTLLEHPEWVSGFTSMEVSGHPRPGTGTRHQQ